MTVNTRDAIVSLPLKDEDLLRQALLIDGQWLTADSGATLEVRNPATGQLVARVPNAGTFETRRAIEAAHRALPAWRATLAKDRSLILRRLYELMLEHIDDLAIIMTAEQGKPLSESKGEIRYAAGFVEWFAEEAKRVYGDIVPQNVGGRRILVQKAPIGVFAAITPWNFPSAMITRKAGPGWAVGCTGVIKPASQTPLSALALGVLAQRAGLRACAIFSPARPRRSARNSPQIRGCVRCRSPAAPRSARSCSRNARPPLRRRAWSLAATHPSSYSRTRTSTWLCRAR